MIHVVFKIVLGYLIWKKLPNWLFLDNSKVIDHYIIVGLSLIGILMMVIGCLHIVECLL